MQPLGRDPRLTLASLDDLGPDEVSAAEIRKQIQANGEDYRAPAHQEGADASDSVQVSVDAHGRVEGVEISRRWQERLEPDRFAPALFEAYTAAVRKALDAAAMQAFAAEQRAAGNRPGDDQATGTRPADYGTNGYGASDHQTSDYRTSDYRAAHHRAADQDAAGGSEVDEAEWLAAKWDALDEISAELARLIRVGTSSGAGSSEKTVSSPHGYLTLRVLGKGVVGISGDVRHIRVADPEQLRREAIAAFQAAERTGDS